MIDISSSHKADGFSRFPKRLEDGEKVSLHVKFAHIKEGYSGMVTIYPNCKDSTDKRYWGKQWKFDASLDWDE